MRRFNMIHLCAGGEPRRMIGRDDPQITATYWDGLNVVGTETVATWLGMALCDPWFKGDEHQPPRHHARASSLSRTSDGRTERQRRGRRAWSTCGT